MTIISVMYLKVTVTLVSPLLFFCGYYNSKKTKWNVTMLALMLAYTICSGRDLHNEAIFILLLAMFDFNCLFKEVLVLFLLGSNLEFTGCCYGRNIVSLESHFLRHRPTELLSHAKCAYDFFPLCLVSNGQRSIISKKSHWAQSSADFFGVGHHQICRWNSFNSKFIYIIAQDKNSVL